jgi:hypothetical protein
MATDRHENGQFKAGEWKGGPGRKTVRREKDYCLEFRKGCSPTSIRKITHKLVELALDGDLRACRLLFEYSMGKPNASINVVVDDAQTGAMTPAEATSGMLRLLETLRERAKKAASGNGQPRPQNRP